jgi:predicted DNA-binding transcriptional regulator YafY
VTELAREMECSERTIWRDLQDLEAAGFLLSGQKEEGRSRVGFVEGYQYHLPLPLSYSELIFLYLSKGYLQSLQGTPLQEPCGSFFARIQTGLSAPMIQFLKEVEAAIPTQGPRTQADLAGNPLIEQITQAIMDRQTLEIDYHSASRGKVKSRKIDPYRLWYQESCLYLIAYCHLRQKVLVFIMDRIRAARPTLETFALPERFHFEEYVKESFGQLIQGEVMRVQILFSANQARWVGERIWHPSQKMQYQLDGSLLMSLEVADTLELKRWILGFGQEAEVLEPKELRQAIRKEAEALLDKYLLTARRAARPKGKPGAEPPKEKLRIEIL